MVSPELPELDSRNLIGSQNLGLTRIGREADRVKEQGPVESERQRLLRGEVNGAIVIRRGGSKEE